MNWIQKIWAETMQISEARWLVNLFVLVTCILVAVYVAKWFRDLAVGNNDDEFSSANHLDEIQRLRDEGLLETEEYQRLKNALHHRDSGDGSSPKQSRPLTLAEANAKKQRDAERQALSADWESNMKENTNAAD